MTWLHYAVPGVGLLLLAFLWLFGDDVLRHPARRRYPPIDGVVVGLLVAVSYLWFADPPDRVLRVVTVVLFVLLVPGSVVVLLAWARIIAVPLRRWHRRGLWTDLLYGLSGLTRAGPRALWRRPVLLWWWLRHPRVHRAYRRVGLRRLAVIVELARWFTPGQVRELGRSPGWGVDALSYAPEHMAGVDTTGWDAEAFLRTVGVAGRDVRYAFHTWSRLYRLGVEDPTEALRYISAGDHPDLAVEFALGPVPVPHEVVRALRRGGVLAPWRLMQRLRDEYREHGHRYPNGWTSLVAWIEHAGQPLFALDRSGAYANWNATWYFGIWRVWSLVGERAPHLEPALWAAAGFSVDEAMAMIDAGNVPDADLLLGLAALRREAA